MPIYRCKGCDFSTDNLDVFIRHVIDERLPKTPPRTPPNNRLGHPYTVEALMNCPDCYPKLEKGMRAKGYRRTLCPTCGVKLFMDILSDYLNCPKCGKRYRP